jgi:lipid-binding SYLF domain-containing protein
VALEPGSGPVVVADRRGPDTRPEARLLASSDGRTWVATRLPAPAAVAGVAFVRAGFVAIGRSGTGSFVARSSDGGRTWAPGAASPAEVADWSAVGTDGQGLVAVGRGGAVASDDGAQRWTGSVAALPDLGTPVAVAFTGATTVLAGRGLAVSTDAGASWRTAGSPPPGSVDALAGPAPG